MTTPSQDPVRADIRHPRLLGASTILLIILMSLAYAAGNMPWSTLGALLIAGGVLVAGLALWLQPGIRWSDVGAAPVPVAQLQRFCTGGAAAMLGLAFLSVSMAELPGARWEVTAVVGASTLLCLYGFVMFLAVRSRAGRQTLRTADSRS